MQPDPLFRYTRGHHANVCGFLFELLVSGGTVDLTLDCRLPRKTAEYYGKKSCWLPVTIHEAFRHLLRLGLVAVEQGVAGRPVAVPSIAALRELLRCDLELERQGKAEKELPTLRYCRGRRRSARHAWLEQVFIDLQPPEQECTAGDAP